MKNTKLWNVALALGAMTLAANGANAQYYQAGGGSAVVLGGNYNGGGVVVGQNGAAAPYTPYAPYNYGNYGYSPYAYYGNYGYNPYAAFDVNGYNGYYDYNGYYNYAPNAAVPAGDNAGYNNTQTPNGAPIPAPNGTVPRRAVTQTARFLPRTTDTIEARRMTGKRFQITWNGENSAVNKITFAMLDANKRAIQTRTVLQPPGECTFPISTRAAYYQVVVEYVNGTTNTVTSPL